MLGILDDVKTVDGVIGAAFYSSQEGILASNLPALFRAEVLEPLGRYLRQLYEAGRTAFGDIPELSLDFADLGVTVRSVAKSHNLIVLHEPAVNRNLLTVGLNVAEEALENQVIRHAFEPSLKSPSSPPKVRMAAAPSLPMSEVLTAVEGHLLKVLGPIAPIIFKESLDLWLAHGKAEPGRLSELLALLEAEINDMDRIEKFRQLVAPHIAP